MNTLDKLSYIALGFVLGGLIIGIAVKVNTDKDWRTQLNNAKPSVAVHADTLPNPPISIVKPLQPRPRIDTLRIPIPLTADDSTAIHWGYWFLKFWANLGYDANEAAKMQDSLTVDRGFEISDDRIGYLKVQYQPLNGFTLNIDELRPATITHDTSTVMGPIVTPKGTFEYIVEYAGYALALFVLVVGLFR